MGVSRAHWLVFAAGCMSVAAIAGCSARPAQTAADGGGAQTLAPTEIVPGDASPASIVQASDAEAACYIEADSQWTLLEGEREATCFERDNCSGGLGDGQPPGTCLKWAIGPEAPALAWSRALTNPTPAADVRPPNDIYEGSYEITSDCHEKGCAYGSVRFSADTPVYPRTDRSAPIVASIPAGECVDTEADALLQAPRRGIVLESRGRFMAGDVIYLTSYEGEGFSTVWRRGEYLDGFMEEAVVRWDAAATHPREGYWVQVTRANGQGGWVRNADTSERGCNPARN